MEFTDTLLSFGYFGLFLSALVAATLLPMGSEAVLYTLASQGFNPLWLLLVATSGNVLGSCVNYAIGFWLHDRYQAKASPRNKKRLKQAEGLFQRYGVWSLLFAWLPVIGDPLTLIAGVLKTRFLHFLILVTIGKCFRYALLLTLV